MAHQGEDIKFTVKGDASVNLDELDFLVAIYKSCDCDVDDDKIVKLTKSANFKAVKDGNDNPTNTYVGTIPSATTATMEDGHYNIELLTKTADGERSIYMQKHALIIECSVSKNIEL